MILYWGGSRQRAKSCKTIMVMVADLKEKQGKRSCLRVWKGKEGAMQSVRDSSMPYLLRMLILMLFFSLVMCSKLKSSLKVGSEPPLPISPAANIINPDSHHPQFQINIITVSQMQMQTVYLTNQQEDSNEENSPLEGPVPDELGLMTANLLKIKREITERDEQEAQYAEEEGDQICSLGHKKGVSSQQQQNMTGPQSAYFSETMVMQVQSKYKEYLCCKSLPTNHEEKLNILLDEELTVGSAVALFEMLFYFREAINEQVLAEITEKALQALIELVEGQSQMERQEREVQQYCLIELLAVCGVYSERLINLVIESLLEERLNFMLCFILLSNMGFGGLAALVHLARQDFQEIPMLILDNLSRSEEVVCQLIIPTLVEDLLGSKNKGKEREIILSVLNRLGGLVGSHPNSDKTTKLFQFLIELMQSNGADRGFISSVLRSAGLEGEKILLEFMAQAPNNHRIMLPIVSILPWKPSPDPLIRIKVIEYTLGSNFLPGTLYQYEGNIEPSAFCFQDQPCCDSLCINARDFIAALQRLLSLKMESFENEETLRRGPANGIKNFLLFQVIGKKSQEEEEEGIQISPDVVLALTKTLANPKPEIREAVLNSLGLIGLPEAFDSIESISKCLWDKDSRNRSMACWALSKLCEQPCKKIVNRLIELLRDSFWKVRISACICMGAIVEEPQENVVQGLVRCLRDNSVNKVTVCETIIKLGPLGEQIVLQIVRNASKNDFKLKEAVIYCLKDADVRVSSIDFVLEEIFKHCKGTRVETRVACLETLNSLRLKATQEGEEIVYLKAKTILPFYYYFLEDTAPKIREMAAEAIFTFGGQAELIFIEGMTKGNPTVRIESAKGLGRLGIQNFRALILGLRDDDPNVRKVTSDVILSNFSPDDVGVFYSKKKQQVASLLCNLKDILMSGGLSPRMRLFVKEAIYTLQKYSQNIDINDSSFFQTTHPYPLSHSKPDH